MAQQSFVSALSLEEPVIFKLNPKDKGMPGKIQAVKFTNYGKVLYDIECEHVTFHDIDSALVIKL